MIVLCLLDYKDINQIIGLKKKPNALRHLIESGDLTVIKRQDVEQYLTLAQNEGIAVSSISRRIGTSGCSISS